jgi:CRISPR-associated protein Cas1
MEELRPAWRNRFVLTMINNRIISPGDFETSKSGAVSLTENARRTFLKAGRQRKGTALPIVPK